MKEFRKIVSMLLVLVFLSTSAISSFSALQDANDSLVDSKIDRLLLKVLDEAEEDDLIPISIWLTDIDHAEVKMNVEEHFANLQKEDEYTNAIEVVFYDDLLINSSDSNIVSILVDARLDTIEERASKVSVDVAKEVIDTEREVARELYKDHNESFIGEFIENNDIRSNEYEIIYSCRYAPNVDLYLSKRYISDLCIDINVEKISFIDTEAEISETTFDINQSEVKDPPQTNSVYDTTFYDVTGLSDARKRLGLDGTGMKVGMLEAQGHPIKKDVTNKTMYYAGGILTKDGSDRHATLVAKLMVGDTEDYIGAIPNAELYFDSILNISTSVKSRVERLLDQGVNAINMSFCVGGSTNCNEYNTISRFYDHVSIQHNVHIVISSGNYGVTGVPNSNMSYNAIVVGACDNAGDIMLDYDNVTIASSYCSVENKSFKPDIVTPGVDIDILPYNYFLPHTEEYQKGYLPRGTSFSAPLVTSAVIQLSQASTLLLSNPTLMKSLLLSSSTITSDMIENDPVYSTVVSDSIALSRMYGAGMLNVTNAYNAFVTKGDYITNSFSNYSTGAIFNRNITGVTNKTLRFCLTWDRYITVDGDEHETGEINNSNLDNLRLEVVTPSGAKYKSNFLYDNKQMITFNATEDGYYSIRVYRQGTANSNNVVDYSITYSIQEI